MRKTGLAFVFGLALGCGVGVDPAGVAAAGGAGTLTNPGMRSARLPGSLPAGQTQGMRDVRQLLFGKAIVREARKFLGWPYAWGGDDPHRGFDCSGYTRYVYGRMGIQLPRLALQQFQQGQEIERPALQAGDLVFFLSPSPQASLHVGIYEGHGFFLHAPGEGLRVRESRMDGSFFSARYMGARRWMAPEK